MNTAVDQAEALRQQAIALLIADRTVIDAQLARLGFDGAAPEPEKKARTCSKCGQSGHNAKSCAATPTTEP